jgi:hypothetical protein
MAKSRLAAAAMAAVMAAGTLTWASAPAEAGWRRNGYHNHGGYYGRPYYGPRYGYYKQRGWNPGAAVAVGAITGLALGAILAAPRSTYYAPAPVYYAPPPPAYQPYCFWQYYANGARAWVCT